jgi:predicted phage terminase large subunit-like protein
MIEPNWVQTPALDVLDQALIDAESGEDPWLLFSMPPQEGKSERVSRSFPVWCLARNPERRIGIVSYADALAMRWGRRTRNDITRNPSIGLAIAADIAAAKEWELDGHGGGMITTGIGGGLTGRRVDVLIIDDPLKDQAEADSPTMRQRCKDFWQSVASTRLGETTIVVVVQTRWHEDDMFGWLAETQPTDFKEINIPAQADHKPERGETDVLGREPGEYMVSARERTVEGWEKKKRSAGTRAWNALYQGRPAPEEGGIFKRTWWRIHALPRAVERSDSTWYVPGADEVLISLDAAFKETSSSDYVAFGVWARRGPKLDLVDIVCDRMEFTETCRVFETLVAKWPQATLRLIEDKANGPAVISALRNRVGGLVPYTPVDSKIARARAVAPFVEAGDVGLPDPLVNPKVAAFIEQCASFPNAPNDDMVDMFTQAAIRMLRIGAESVMDELVRELGLHEEEQDEIVPMRAWSPQDAEETDADPDDEPWM